MNNIIGFVKEHKEGFALFGLFVVCYFLFFYNMGNYPLIDVDETRYVSIARDMLNVNDWMTLKLNNEYFFEKPPLYFWLMNTFFLIFGQISEVVARLPIALCSTLGVFLTYFMGKRIISKKFGLISALILATGFEYIVLTRVAILDLLLTVMTYISVLCGFMTFFTSESRKKFYWWAFYIFSGLAVMAKGIPGFVIPFGTMFFSYLFVGKVKELFKPIYILPGVVIFFLITLPWHILMMHIHGDLFFKEYVMKHHLARFVDSKDLGRKEPWFFFIVTFIVGFLPWTLSFVSMLIDKAKSFVDGVKNYFYCISFVQIGKRWELLGNTQKFMTLNLIAFLVIFIFFSSASTKLPTYILPAFGYAAFLLANYWDEYITENRYVKNIAISTIILHSIFLIVAIGAIFTPLFLTDEILVEIAAFRIPAMMLFTFVPIIAIFSVILKNRKLVFVSHILLMLGIVIICSNSVFNFVCNFGENDLIKYAQKAKLEKTKLATFDFGKRYSVNYYYEGVVDYQVENDINWLRRYTEKNPNAYIIVKIKNMSDIDGSFKYKVIDTGKKYCLIKKQ